MEKIIIDDVDVSKCDWLSEKNKNYCYIFNQECEKLPDCYYKQLQRLDKAYRELMEDDARALARLDKAEFENRKLKRENQELRDNYINLDLQRIEEYGILLEDYYKMRDLFLKTSGKLVKLQEELDPNIHLKTIDFKIGEENK